MLHQTVDQAFAHDWQGCPNTVAVREFRDDLKAVRNDTAAIRESLATMTGERDAQRRAFTTIQWVLALLVTMSLGLASIAITARGGTTTRAPAGNVRVK